VDQDHFRGRYRAHMRAQKPVDDRPIGFDTKSGVRIESVLIVPKYISMTGVSTGAGHGPGRMAEERFLASPLVYHEGSRFQPRQRSLQPTSGTDFVPGSNSFLKRVDVSALRATF
jgi:hypothetical protein